MSRARTRADRLPTLNRRFTQGSLLLLGATLAGFAAGQWWFWELFAHFRVQYTLAALVGVALALGLKRPLWGVLLGFCAGLNGAQLLPLLPNGADLPPPPGPTLRLLSYNLNAFKSMEPEMLAWLERESFDILVLLEVTSEDWQALAPLRAHYPHWTVKPSPTPNGVALLSRVPGTRTAVFEIPGVSSPGVSAYLSLAGRPLTILGLHPPPSHSPQRSEVQDQVFQEVIRLAASRPAPLVVAGDLNSTRWSPRFQNLLTATGLRDSSDGRGWHPTWPSWLVGLPLLIPIDHFLHTPEITVHQRRVGADRGSDHYPLEVIFGWNAPRRAVNETASARPAP
ncbi:MAG: endonuclease/exonuclease/phosphatase family protein [Magnetococcales bacterium]|nr:endonuclease/exonuclease/phosphatase family protein [Magnetococcales bacterium]